MSILKMTDMDLAGKRVLIRQELNVPLKDGKVANDKRIRTSLPTVRAALDKGAKVMVMSHLGRPTEGEFEEKFSLAPVAEYMADLLGVPVTLSREYLDSGCEPVQGAVTLLENVRFNVGEKKDDEGLAKKYAALCDVFVMDAFGAAHRAQASTHAVARFAPVACAGLLLASELESLQKGLGDPARPLVAIVGGAKVDTKLTILASLMDKVDTLIVGGGIANDLLAASGKPIGTSLCSPELRGESERILALAKEKGVSIPLPVDVVVAKELAATAVPAIRAVDEVREDEMILDIGPQTAKAYARIVSEAGTVVWNGPVGVFEYDQFAGGTKVLGHAIKASKAFSVVGGGDVVTAVEAFGIADGMSYISTGGGSFLEFLEGKTLPAVAILEERGA